MILGQYALNLQYCVAMFAGGKLLCNCDYPWLRPACSNHIITCLSKQPISLGGRHFCDTVGEIPDRELLAISQNSPHPASPTEYALRDFSALTFWERYMSSNLDVYQRHFEAACANPPSSLMEANERYLADDIQSLDLERNVQLTREAYLGLTHLLFVAYTDFRTVISDAREQGDSNVTDLKIR